jgi:hypothetical protein
VRIMKDQIPSKSLAVLIVDRLVYAKCLDESDFDKGVAIAKHAIDSRKALGDYDGKKGMESFDLGMLIVNDLIKADVVVQRDFEKAVECADEEIIARKAAGDY